MTCDGCAKDISSALNKLPGITKVEANVKDQLVSIEGTGPYDYATVYRMVVFLELTFETGQWRHRPSLKQSRQPGGTPSYEGQGPQTVSAPI